MANSFLIATEFKEEWWGGSDSVMMVETNAQVPDSVVTAIKKINLARHVWIKTSGSSQLNSQQWIALSFEALFASSEAVNERVGAREADRWLLTLPQSHVGGLSILARAHLTESKVFRWNNAWDASECVSFINLNQITLTSFVPTQIYDFVDKGLRAPACLRFAFVGGAALSAPLYKKARILGWPLLTTYGMTETASQIASSLPEKIPNDDPTLHLYKEVEVELNEEQKLKIKTKSLLTGTLKIQGATADWTPHKTMGFFQTQDRVILHGRAIEVIGRGEDFIKVKGEGINLLELDQVAIEVLSDLKHLAKIAVVPLLDERRGYRLSLASDQKLSPETLTIFNQRVKPFEKAEKLVMLNPWPESNLGKFQRLKAVSELGSRPEEGLE